MKCARCNRPIKEETNSKFHGYGEICSYKLGLKDFIKIQDGDPVNLENINLDAPALMDVVARVAYFGNRSGGEVKVWVTRKEGREEAETRRLIHRVHHSPTGLEWGYPTGLEWGYPGSGSADLARSILWDFLGAQPGMALYQSFKKDIVANFPHGAWFLEGAGIWLWLKNKQDGVEEVDTPLMPEMVVV